MTLKSYAKYGFIGITIGHFLSWLNSYYFGTKKEHAKEEIHEVISFYQNQNDTECKKSKYSKCMITKSMSRLLYYISSPKYSIDVCMFVFTNLYLMNSFIELHHKGVKIRFIVDADMAYASGSCIRKLEKLGIPVRWMKSLNLMHHKFCLIDALSGDTHTTPIAVYGSLNWTNQGLSGNWEGVIVTSQPEIVSQLKVTYETLWSVFNVVTDV